MKKRKIILIRHAKSSWEQNVEDYDRDLLSIGIDKTNKIGIATKDLIPNECEIWTSSAKRAHKTAKIICKIWDFPKTKLTVKKELYTFNVNQLEEIVKSCPNQCNYLIIFGHNNAITDFVNKFGDILIENVPTSAFVCIKFNAQNWKTLTKGTTEKIIFPSHL